MYFFELGAPGGDFKSYRDALYWTGMMLTTMGSAYWPVSGEGRVLAFLLSRAQWRYYHRTVLS
jgi:voltage-gated potassium channel